MAGKNKSEGEDATGYELLNGHRTWVRRGGAGDDVVVLLHGGMSDGEEFDENLASLGDTFGVVRADRRGHGRTPDAEGPLSQHGMADDTVALIESLDVGPVRLVGYSDGAVVALLTALRRPELVSRLVLISGVHERRGWIVTPEHDGADQMPEEIVHRFGEISPDGADHFPVVAHKLADMATEELGVSEADLAALPMRTLVVAADDDIVHLEHTLATYRQLGRAELAVVPGTSHALLWEKPELVTRLVRDFLTHDAADTMIPLRRAHEPTE